MQFEKGTWTEWQPAAKKPDADQTVLVYSPKADEPCWLGYWDGEVWRDMDNIPYATQVEMWAELPYPVEKKTGKGINGRGIKSNSAAIHSTANQPEAAL